MQSKDNSTPPSDSTNTISPSRRAFLKQVALASGALAASGFVGVLPAFAQDEDVFLRAVVIQPARVDAFNAIMEPFLTAHPNVTLEIIGVPAGNEWAPFLQRVAVLIASGQQVDNIEMGSEGFQLLTTSGIIRPLDDIVMNDPDIGDFLQDVAPAMIESHMLNGSLYNLAFLWAAAGINYNKRLFDQAGLDYPTDEWTVDDFQTAARAIGALGDDIFGYAWPNRQWGGFVPWSYANDAFLLEPAQSEGGEWLWDTYYPDMSADDRAKRGGGWTWVRATANDANNVEALEMLQGLSNDGAAYMVGPGGLPDLWAAFSTGNLGMMVSHRAWVARFNGAGMSPDDYDVVYHPMWKTRRSQFGASGLAVTTLSPHPDEAFALLLHLTSREIQSQFIAGGVHTASRRSVTNAPEQNEGITPSNWQAYYGQIDNVESFPIPSPAQNGDFTDSMTRWFDNAMNGGMSAQEAMDGFTAEVNTLLGVE